MPVPPVVIDDSGNPPSTESHSLVRTGSDLLPLGELALLLMLAGAALVTVAKRRRFADGDPFWGDLTHED